MFLFADILGAWWEHSVAWGGMSAEVWSGKLAEKAERWSELATPEELHDTEREAHRENAFLFFKGNTT